MPEPYEPDKWGRNYLTVENVDSVAQLLRELLEGKTFAVVTYLETSCGSPSVVTGLNLSGKMISVEHGFLVGDNRPTAQLYIMTPRYRWDFSASLKEEVEKVDVAREVSTRITFGQEYVAINEFTTVGGSEGSIYSEHTRRHTLLIVQRKIDS